MKGKIAFPDRPERGRRWLQAIPRLPRLVRPGASAGKYAGGLPAVTGPLSARGICLCAKFGWYRGSHAFRPVMGRRVFLCFSEPFRRFLKREDRTPLIALTLLTRSLREKVFPKMRFPENRIEPLRRCCGELCEAFGI